MASSFNEIDVFEFLASNFDEIDSLELLVSSLMNSTASLGLLDLTFDGFSGLLDLESMNLQVWLTSLRR